MENCPIVRLCWLVKTRMAKRQSFSTESLEKNVFQFENAIVWKKKLNAHGLDFDGDSIPVVAIVVVSVLVWLAIAVLPHQDATVLV